MVIPRILNCSPAPPQLPWCRQRCVSLPFFPRFCWHWAVDRSLRTTWQHCWFPFCYLLSSLSDGGVARVLHNRVLLMSRSSVAVWIGACGPRYFFLWWGCGHGNKPKPRLWQPAVPHGTLIGLILWIQLCPARKRTRIISTGTQVQMSTDVALCQVAKILNNPNTCVKCLNVEEKDWWHHLEAYLFRSTLFIHQNQPERRTKAGFPLSKFH